MSEFYLDQYHSHSGELITISDATKSALRRLLPESIERRCVVVSDTERECIIAYDSHLDDSFYLLDEFARKHEFESIQNFEGKLRLKLKPMDYGKYSVFANENTLSTLYYCPSVCYAQEKKVKGISLQLYAIQSKDNFGIGDLGDLRKLLPSLITSNYQIVGISPIHALSSLHADRRSPYYPSSRLAYNTNHIDIRSIPEFGNSKETQEYIETSDFREWLSREKSKSIIDYPQVVGHKRKLLKLLYADFVSTQWETNSKNAISLRDWTQADEGRMYFAAFETLVEIHGDDVTKWPKDFQNAERHAVVTLIEKAEYQFYFHAWLQWTFHNQLQLLLEEATRLGVQIYFDIAVGADPTGAEVWAFGDDYTKDFTVGAPPDPFSETGQNWGITPLLPHKLWEKDFEPFLRILRANMPLNGMIRIDHVMALFRLFWIPQGQNSAKAGAYVKYPLRELILLLAYESQKRKCVVIGEDLGTVPDEVRHELKSRNVYSWKVLYFEKNRVGFVDPVDYPELSVATINTHDLPSLTGFWNKDDIALRRQLKVLKDSIDINLAERDRDLDKKRIIDLLKKNHLLQRFHLVDFPFAMDEELMLSIHRMMLKAKSKIVLFSLYDLLCQSEQANLPGTVDEYPNWAVRYSTSIENLSLPAIEINP